jgi:hypothetical protein
LQIWKFKAQLFNQFGAGHREIALWVSYKN